MHSENVWPPILVLAVVVATIGGIYYFHAVDEANRVLLNTQTAHSEATRRLDLRRAKFNELSANWTEEQSLRQALASAAENLDAVRQQLETHRRLAESNVKWASNAMAESVDGLVERIKSNRFDSFELPDGRVFENASIVREDGDRVTLVHADGIVTIGFTELPNEFTRKFDLGPTSIRARLRQLEEELGLRDSDATARKKDRMLIFQRSVEQLTLEVEHAREIANRLELEVARYDAEIARVTATGGLTIQLRSSRDLAEGRAGDARIQLKRLEQALAKLRGTEQSFVNGE